MKSDGPRVRLERPAIHLDPIGRELPSRSTDWIISGVTDSGFNTDKPDDTPRKIFDMAILTSLGWQPRIRPADGIRDTWQWYRPSLVHVGA